jgi:voltage-gated potassium channel
MTVPRRRRIGALDWVMLVLAIVSVGLLSYATFWHPPPDTARLIFRLDLGFCAVFAVEFLVRWRAAGWTRRFLTHNWYDLLGMIPVSHPALRGLRLLRVVRVVVLLSRLGRAMDRSAGEEFTYRLMSRFSGTIVNALKKPLTVAVLEEVVAVLRTGHYARNVARALEENRGELRQLVLDKLKQDPQIGRLSIIPFHDEIVRSMSDAALRVVLEVLADARTDELISDVLRENIDQIRQAVRSGQHTDQLRRAAAP